MDFYLQIVTAIMFIWIGRVKQNYAEAWEVDIK